MSNSATHAALPYPIRGARFTIEVPYLDADGDPTDPTTPDTEVSKDGGAFADCAEEVSTVTGSNGLGYLTLSGAEMDASMLGVAAKVASGPKATLMTLYPRVLVAATSGTMSSGSASGGALAAAIGYDLSGCFIKTTGGTGGGGTGGANNQVRVMTSYVMSSGSFGVTPDWEVQPDSTTTYEVLLPSGVTLGMLRALNPTTAGRTLDVDADGAAEADMTKVSGTTISGNTPQVDVTKWNGSSVATPDVSGVPKVDVAYAAGSALSPSVAQFGAKVVEVDSSAGVGTSANQTTIISSLTAAKGSGFSPSTDSLEALRDRGDAAWITGGGGSITQSLNVQVVIPTSIDLADTATVRLGMILVNALDDLPSTAEITPGTISIDRKAIGGTSWSSVVSDAAMSEQAGMVYYDEAFDSGSGYAEGDSIRVTFKSVSITADTNTHEVCDANGLIFQTEVRQTMRGTDSANTTTPPTAAAIRAEIDSNSTVLIAIKGSGFSPSTDSLASLRDRGDAAWLTASGFSTHSAENVRTEMDSNSTQFAALVAAVAAVQGSGFSPSTDALDAIRDRGDAAWTGDSAAAVRAEMDSNSTQLAALIASLSAAKGSGFSPSTDSLEAIRDRGDSAWITGGGGSGSGLALTDAISSDTEDTVGGALKAMDRFVRGKKVVVTVSGQDKLRIYDTDDTTVWAEFDLDDAVAPSTVTPA